MEWLLGGIAILPGSKASACVSVEVVHIHVVTVCVPPICVSRRPAVDDGSVL